MKISSVDFVPMPDEDVLGRFVRQPFLICAFRAIGAGGEQSFFEGLGEA